MAKKKVSKKKVAKKASSASKPSKRGSAASSKKKTTKKKTTKKKTTAAKTTTRKPTSKKTGKKTTAKKTTKKKTSPLKTKATSKKKSAKTASKKSTAKKTTAKKKTTKSKKPTPAAKKTTNKKTTKKKTTSKPAAKGSLAPPEAKNSTPAKSGAQSASQPAKGSNAAGGDASKQQPPKKRRPSKAKKVPLVMPTRPLLLGPNGPALKPLIPSGTRVDQKTSVLDNVTSRRKKTPLTKTQLAHYRQILLNKRAELLGDMRHLEEEALRSDTGASSHTSQHLAEKGSDSYDQSLNLNLAASDRQRIYEIDAALERIEDRTYGLCELTFEPIKRARLDEIPWARYTIEAARELDRRGQKH